MSYPICIKCSSKAKVTSFHGIYQRAGVSQVGLWRSTTKVLQRDTVDSRVSRSSQLITQDPTYIGAHNCNTTRGETCRGEENVNSLISNINHSSWYIRWWIVSPPFMASMCILSWSGPVRRLLMALKSKMLRSSCRYTSTESTISTRNTDKIYDYYRKGFLTIWQPNRFSLLMAYNWPIVNCLLNIYKATRYKPFIKVVFIGKPLHFIWLFCFNRHLWVTDEWVCECV